MKAMIALFMLTGILSSAVYAGSGCTESAEGEETSEQMEGKSCSKKS